MTMCVSDQVCEVLCVGTCRIELCAESSVIFKQCSDLVCASGVVTEAAKCHEVSVSLTIHYPPCDVISLQVAKAYKYCPLSPRRGVGGRGSRVIISARPDRTSWTASERNELLRLVKSMVQMTSGRRRLIDEAMSNDRELLILTNRGAGAGSGLAVCSTDGRQFAILFELKPTVNQATPSRYDNLFRDQKKIVAEKVTVLKACRRRHHHRAYVIRYFPMISPIVITKYNRQLSVLCVLYTNPMFTRKAENIDLPYKFA
ncbi:hypothetical protein EVAR_86292_1 [Eumeta japonica]|uniref:Uncharacterized protein n=1 Tax=Eumeta variegata TaxID=151549 RepID=A0A4C1UBS5_EUMVA|nr:hypothetical protein EVAR_86292_1 [Eumeta japonica]